MEQDKQIIHALDEKVAQLEKEQEQDMDKMENLIRTEARQAKEIKILKE